MAHPPSGSGSSSRSSMTGMLEKLTAGIGLGLEAFTPLLTSAGLSHSSHPQYPRRRLSDDLGSPTSPLLRSSPTFGKRAFHDSPSSRRSLFGRTLRESFIHPFILLSRRGPIYPFLALVSLVLLLSFTSSSTTSQRVQVAVRPFIPRRAADVINWRPPDYIASRERKKLAQEAARKKASAAAAAILKEPKKVVPPSSFEAGIPTRKDGRTTIEVNKKHPIPALMKAARQKWETLTSKQSKTFGEAVDEYVRRYDLQPPKGFDKWYAFARANKVQLIDEFDLINKDLLMYRAFTPEVFRSRVEYLIDALEVTWTITIENGKISRGGPLSWHDRARGVVELMQRFSHEIPDMKLVYNGHDSARIPVPWEERSRLEDLARRKQFDEDTEIPFTIKERGPAPHWGMAVFCPSNSAVRAPGFEYGWPDSASTGLELSEVPSGAIGTLIVELDQYMDVCNSPQYRHYHACTSYAYSQHPSSILPLFTPGVQATMGDIHGLIVEQLELVQEHDPTWESRPFTALQWRGQTSGPQWDAATPWQTTHRARIHLLSHEEMGLKNVIVTDHDEAAQSIPMPNYRVNPLFLDTGMVGPAVQCIVEDGTCEKMHKVFDGYDKRMSFDRASLYKYVLDIDGNSWSGRFRRLMKSNAAVVKATIFPEFWTDWAIPWLHFIPMQVDYSDMWDIMAFFRGGLDGEGAHDLLGKEIAMAGQDWVDKYYRGADLEAYQFRLLLEYARLYTDETSTGSNDFDGDVTMEPVWKDAFRSRMTKAKRAPV